jgi:hypothetical protein
MPIPIVRREEPKPLRFELDDDVTTRDRQGVVERAMGIESWIA